MSTDRHFRYDDDLKNTNVKNIQDSLSARIWIQTNCIYFHGWVPAGAEIVNELSIYHLPLWAIYSVLNFIPRWIQNHEPWTMNDELAFKLVNNYSSTSIYHEICMWWWTNKHDATVLAPHTLHVLFHYTINNQRSSQSSSRMCVINSIQNNRGHPHTDHFNRNESIFFSSYFIVSTSQSNSSGSLMHFIWIWIAFERKSSSRWSLNYWNC